MKKKTIDEYIEIAKTDIILYIIVLLILSLILLYISFRVNWYYLMIFSIVFSFSIINKIIVYHTLRNIKDYLIKNDLLDKIGEIIFWNEKNYLLTDNYIIISEYNIISYFEYDDILEITKRNDTVLNSRCSHFDEYLVITFKDGQQIEVLMYSTALVSEEVKDITEFLLNKNNKIKFYK